LAGISIGWSSAVAAALVLKGGDVFKRQIARDPALIVNDKPKVALAGFFVGRRQVGVIGGFDRVAIAGIEDKHERDKRPSVQLRFEKFQGDHGL
jgi:hypothetical protein